MESWIRESEVIVFALWTPPSYILITALHHSACDDSKTLSFSPHATSPRLRGCVSMSARSFSLPFVPQRQFFHGFTRCPEALGEAHATQQRNNPKKAHHIPLVYGRTKHGIKLESLLRMRVFSMLCRALGFNRHTTHMRTRVTLIFMIYC